MKKQTIKGAKPANTSKTSTSNSTSSKTSAKGSSTSTTSKHPTADTNPTTAGQTVPTTSSTSKQSAVEVEIVKGAAGDSDNSATYAIWLDKDFVEGNPLAERLVEILIKSGHIVAIDESTPNKPHVKLLVGWSEAKHGMSVGGICTDATRRDILLRDGHTCPEAAEAFYQDTRREVRDAKREAKRYFNSLDFDALESKGLYIVREDTNAN